MSRGPIGSTSACWRWWRSLPGPFWSLQRWRWRWFASRANSRCWACSAPRHVRGWVRCWRRAPSWARSVRCWAQPAASGWRPCCWRRSAATWVAATSADRGHAWCWRHWRWSDLPCLALRSVCWARSCRHGRPRAQHPHALCAAAAPKTPWQDWRADAGPSCLPQRAQGWSPRLRSMACRSAPISPSHCGWSPASPACRCSPERLDGCWPAWQPANCGAGRQPGWPRPALRSRRVRLPPVWPVWSQALP